MKQVTRDEVAAIAAATDKAAAIAALENRTEASAENIRFCVTAALGLRPCTPHVREYSRHYVNLWLANANEDPIEFEDEEVEAE